MSEIAKVPRLSIGAVKARKREEALEYSGALVGVTRCVDCRWSYRGVFRDGRKAYQAHRERRHA